MLILRTFSNEKDQDPIKRGARIAGTLTAAGAGLGAIGGLTADRIYKSGGKVGEIASLTEKSLKAAGDKRSLKTVKQISKIKGRSLAKNVGVGALQNAGRWAIPGVAIGGIVAYKKRKNK